MKTSNTILTISASLLATLGLALGLTSLAHRFDPALRRAVEVSPASDDGLAVSPCMGPGASSPSSLA